MIPPPLISIIIPVWREEDNILKFLDPLQKANKIELCEIIVCDGDPDHTTLNSISNPVIIKIQSQKGRAVQMNKGAQIARGKHLLFLHADTDLPKDAIECILKIMDSGKYVGGAFDVEIDAPQLKYKVLSFFASLRARWTRIPYGDQAIFIRKNVFKEVGMYPNVPILEDIELMLNLKRNKHKIFIHKSKVLTSARRWKKLGFIQCTLNHRLLALLHWVGVPANKLSVLYSKAR